MTNYIVQNDFEIVTMMITKILILPKPFPMKHCHLNNLEKGRHKIADLMHTQCTYPMLSLPEQIFFGGLFCNPKKSWVPSTYQVSTIKFEFKKIERKEKRR
jgi:hypothetical protein